MRSDQQIWREFLDFRIMECLGLWSRAVIHFPFGRMILLHPDDAPCLLMEGSLERASPAQVLGETEALVSGLDLGCAFMFSSAWRGDVAAFKAYISERGYRPAFEQFWMVKEDFSDIESIPDSGYIIDDTPNSAVVKDLYRRALGASDALSDLLKRKLDTGGGPINTGFVVAKTPNGEPVACGGYSHASTISYFHCLGTLKEHRRRGIAKHMAKVRLRMMRERGVEYTVGAVSKRNIPSIEMQKSLGYRVLEETVIWRKIE